jgi:hypothetical protein
MKQRSILSRGICDCRRGLDRWIDLLNTYTHNSSSSPTVPWQRFLTMDILQLHALRSSVYRLRCRTQLNWLCPLLIISRHGPHRKHSFSIFECSCCIFKNLLPSNGNVFTEPSLFTESPLSNGSIRHITNAFQSGNYHKNWKFTFLCEFWRCCQKLDCIASNSMRSLIDD